MPRRTVKLLLIDIDDRVLLLHGRDPKDGGAHWYPVGGGIEDGESLQEAAAREAWEETGLKDLPPGAPVWTRDVTYTFGGQAVEVHEDWLHVRVPHFNPQAARLTDYEAASIIGSRWWSAEELQATDESIFPPNLGDLLVQLHDEGAPSSPMDIGDRATGSGAARS